MRAWRRLAALDQPLESEDRIPRVRRDDDDLSICAKHALDRCQRRRLIGKMLERSDEQDEIKPPGTFHAKSSGIARSKLQRRGRGSALRAGDHAAADIDAGARSNEVDEVQKSLAGTAAEIEHMRPAEIATSRTQIANACAKFASAHRSRSVLGIPALCDGVELSRECRSRAGHSNRA
jgi:hypothetical protein